MDLKSVLKEYSYDKCAYWFIPLFDGTISVYLDGKFIETVTEETIDVKIYKESFDVYKSRPEYILIQLFNDKSDFSDLKLLYDELLIGSNLILKFMRTLKNPDDKVGNAFDCIKWLESTDFYDAPASTRFHDNVEHGLLLHSIKVVLNVVDLLKLKKFKTINSCLAVRCALIHDFCKINYYESYLRNVKDEKTNQWNQVLSYRVKEDPMIRLGHGISSMYIATKFFKLSLEESYAIRWHMGKFRCDDSEVYDLGYCNENYPLVYLLQFADQLAITNY